MIDIDNNGYISIKEMIDFLESVTDDISESEVLQRLQGLQGSGSTLAESAFLPDYFITISDIKKNRHFLQI